ncbi:pyruvate, phosphate dikinase [Actinorhabdospora filicis]|uniref:Pyruvate, phosphate dikinase n=2 Tax=Actinorhabdospora filicis TaxID=1785913 RepID=A0A9W6W4P1_9ACTN|nr:pyruvate, phosphate dikinase [Actinorhabdospora filicis]
MTRIGLPVPPGFTITTEACRAYLADGDVPSTLDAEIAEHLAALEASMGRTFGDAADPLLVSVRSGAKFSMPGMMDTVLNVGLSDTSVAGLAAQSGSERFAFDSYRRLIQMFGKTVLGVPGDPFEDAIHEAKTVKGVTDDVDLDAADLRALVEAFKKIVAEHTGAAFPQEPAEQLRLAVRAVFQSWQGERAVLYRRTERIPDDLGTAVNIVAMVFGNLGADSGTGVAFTRDPATGASGVYGDYLPNAQGEDVVAGIRNTVAIAELERLDKESYDELMRSARILEDHYRDLCDIEFTIERGRLWLLQTRVGKRTAAAAFTIASSLVDDGLIDIDTATRRVTGAQLAQLMFPTFGDVTDVPRVATGVPASPGAAVGAAVFDAHRAAARAATGAPVILVRKETNPDDLPGMIAAKGVLTARGGKTSHAAVVARGMGKTCVCGADALQVNADHAIVGDVTIHEGDIISVDGSTGAVYLGEVPVRPSPVVEFFETGEVPEGDPLIAAVARIMGHADQTRRLGVRANADTGEDAARARRFGAAGIGLCRTEHMFLGERRVLVERLVLAGGDAEREPILGQLLDLQRADFGDILRAMDGLPVTIRLLDPPLHEFLPSLEDLAVEVALAQARGESDEHRAGLLAAVRRIHEQNPMLGLRGVRLGLVLPGLYEMQVRAIAEAAAALRAEGLDPRPEIMVPLVGDVRELAVIRERAEAVLAEVGGPAPIGTMIEVPRAALTAGSIAEKADFFSFGTNDLTQLTWGFSRDDVEGAFFGRYLELGVFPVSPFETLDATGVGELVRVAVERGRATRPGLHLGVCGEHGGDPESVRFLHAVGLDYVSCSPFRVPVARLAAGQAVIEERQSGEHIDSR